LKLKLSTRRAIWAYAFLLVPLLFFLLVRIYPTLQSFQLSLSTWHVDPLQREFVGLDYYERMLNDGRLHQAFRNTLYYALLGVPALIIIGLTVAMLLHGLKNPFGRGLFRAIYFAPYVTPAVAVSWAWSLMLSPQLGIVNEILFSLGLPTQPFLNSPDTALATVTGVVVWQYLGFQVILFLVGLEGIPRQYYEAAAIDGANGWSRFRFITLPLLRPVLVLSIIIATASNSTGFLQLFTQVLNLNFSDPGGPLGSTLTIVLYMYQVAFNRFEFGYAAAITVVLFLIIMVITVFQWTFLNKRVDY